MIEIFVIILLKYIASGEVYRLVPGSLNLYNMLAVIEKEIITKAIGMNINRSNTARMLSLNRTTLVNKIKKYKLEDIKHRCDNCQC